MNFYFLKKWLVVFIVISSQPAIAQVAIGIYGGLDQSKFSGDIPQKYTYEFKAGYVAGLTFDFAVAEKVFLSIRPNLTENGADITSDENLHVAPYLKEDPLDTAYLYPMVNRYLAVPVIAQIYVSRAFYANSGIEVAYNFFSEAQVLNEKIDVRDSMNELLFHAVFGFGFSIPVKRTSLNLEFTYAQGLSTLTKRAEIEDGTVPRLRTRRFRLSAYFIVFASKKTI